MAAGDGGIEGHRHEIEKYLDERGIEADGFYDRIRTFFDRSRLHYRRLLIRNRIATYMDPTLDPNSPGGQKQVWKEVVRVIRADAATLTRWNSGEVDPPWEQLIKYFDHTDCPGEDLPLLDRRAAFRVAIARTLTYVAVVPWSAESAVAPKVPPTLERCWKIAGNHRYYQKYHDLNQHLLDSIITAVPEVAVKVESIGAIRIKMESRPKTNDFGYWPFSIFKLATFAKYKAIDSRDNAIKIIWQDNMRKLIWGIENEP